MTRIALTAFLAVLIVIGGFAFFIPHANQLTENSKPSDTASSTVPDVFITDTFKKGVHTIRGLIGVPTPCTTVAAEALVTDETPMRITIAIRVAQDTGICLQEKTIQAFTVTAEATADAVIQATVNGALASTTKKSL